MNKLWTEIKLASIKIYKSSEESYYWLPEWVYIAVCVYIQNDGFADMKLHNYIGKMRPKVEEVAEKKVKKASAYKKMYGARYLYYDEDEKYDTRLFQPMRRTFGKARKSHRIKDKKSRMIGRKHSGNHSGYGNGR